MGVVDLFSKRQRRARGEMPDVYVYDPIPPQLRVQIVYIIRDAFGEASYFDLAHSLYRTVVEMLCREYGMFQLGPHTRNQQDALFDFITKQKDTEQVLDAVELSFGFIDSYVRNDFEFRHRVSRKIEPDDAILELNARFKEHGIGYQYESGEILRVDSEFVHSEIVKPTLAVLRGDGFAGANEEFLEAHQHYRHGRHKECLVAALKAFESVMKAVCAAKKWKTNPNDPATALIAVCFANNLIPPYLETQLGALRTLLSSGVPTVRNRLGGHGQGTEPTVVPAYMARYALNLTASNALLLYEAASEQQ